MPNPTNPFGSTVRGIWVMPLTLNGLDPDAYAWCGARSPESGRTRDEELTDIIGRAEAINQTSGVVRLARGTIDADLYNHEGLTADEWLQRWTNLFERQGEYQSLWLVTPREFYRSIELNGELYKVPKHMSGRAWRISIAWREKRA